MQSDRSYSPVVHGYCNEYKNNIQIQRNEDDNII